MKKSLGLLLSIFLLFSIPVQAGDNDDPDTKDTVVHSDLSWEDYEYARMDEADFDAIVANTEQICNCTDSEDAVLNIIINAENYCNEMYKNSAIAYLHSDLAAKDEYWDNEVLYYTELSVSVSDKMQKMYHTIATSVYAEVLHKRVNEREWQDILDYTEMTAEQKALFQKESELVLQYDILYNDEYSATLYVNSTQSGDFAAEYVTYTEDELTAAYHNGIIDKDRFMCGLAAIKKQKNEALGNLFLDLVQCRNRIAQSYGYENYADYEYKILGRDYKHGDLTEYQSQVKEYMVPLRKEIIALLCDSETQKALSKFSEVSGSAEEALNCFSKYLPEHMRESYDYMCEHHLYDLSANECKAPGSYTISIPYYNAPFLYCNSSGNLKQTIIHEFGHYNQLYHMSSDSWYYNRSNLDLAEIHSQGLEMIYLKYADDMYGVYGDLNILLTMNEITRSCISGVKQDAFEYDIYQYVSRFSNASPNALTLSTVNKLYAKYCEEYGDIDQYDSYYLSKDGYTPKDEILEWVNVPHAFKMPLYYISYSTSAAAVLDLYDHLLKNRTEGMEIYDRLVEAEFKDDFRTTLTKNGLYDPITEPRFACYAKDIEKILGISKEQKFLKELIRGIIITVLILSFITLIKIIKYKKTTQNL